MCCELLALSENNTLSNPVGLSQIEGKKQKKYLDLYSYRPADVLKLIQACWFV